MKTPPRLTLIIAVTLAVATGFLTLNYVSSVNRSEAAQAAPLRAIIVARADIPARATIEISMLHRVMRPASQIEPDAIVDPRKAIGSLALVSIPAGATVTASRVGRPENVALSVVLKRGMRAVSIATDRVKAVGDLIQPGDRVDVIAVPPRVADETPQARTILRGATVLAFGTQMESPAQSSSGQPASTDAQSTVTLGVTAEQADVLASADINATLRLALRSPQEPLDSHKAETFVLPVAPVHQQTAAASFAPPAPAAVPVRAAAPVPPQNRPVPTARAHTVEVIDGQSPSGPQQQ